MLDFGGCRVLQNIRMSGIYGKEWIKKNASTELPGIDQVMGNGLESPSGVVGQQLVSLFSKTSDEDISQRKSQNLKMDAP